MEPAEPVFVQELPTNKLVLLFWVTIAPGFNCALRTWYPVGVMHRVGQLNPTTEVEAAALQLIGPSFLSAVKTSAGVEYAPLLLGSQARPQYGPAAT